MSESLAFQIVNDLLCAEVIVEDILPSEVQILVQARLNLDPRFREGKVVHFRDNKRQSEPVCHQVGDVQVTGNPAKVTCLRCLEMYQVHGTYERW